MLGLSIIVPIYNVEQYLSNCIDSILAQTFTDFELILVDDGSPDRCGEICDFYASIDQRIKVVHKKNEGVSSARNIGIEIARGEYIAFVDPDDTIESIMYETLLQTALRHDADIVVCPIKTIKTVTNTISITSIWRDIDTVINKETIESKIIPSLVLNKTYSLISSVNKIYKRTLFNTLNIRFEEHKNHSEDARFNLRILPRIDRLVFVKQPLYNYFIYKRDSLTQIFREDYYDYILDNKLLFIDLCNKYSLVSSVDIVRNHYTGLTIGYMQDVVGMNLPQSTRYKIITRIIKDKEFRKDIKDFSSPNFYYHILKNVCILGKEKYFLNIVKWRNKIQRYRVRKLLS